MGKPLLKIETVIAKLDPASNTVKIDQTGSNNTVQITGTPSVNISGTITVEFSVAQSVKFDSAQAVTISSGTVDLTAGSVALTYSEDAAKNKTPIIKNGSGNANLYTVPVGKVLFISSSWISAIRQVAGTQANPCEYLYVDTTANIFLEADGSVSGWVDSSNNDLYASQLMVEQVFTHPIAVAAGSIVKCGMPASYGGDAGFVGWIENV